MQNKSIVKKTNTLTLKRDTGSYTNTLTYTHTRKLKVKSLYTAKLTHLYTYSISIHTYSTQTHIQQIPNQTHKQINGKTYTWKDKHTTNRHIHIQNNYCYKDRHKPTNKQEQD